MITSSYSASQAYIEHLEANLEPKITGKTTATVLTPFTESVRYEAPELLNPIHSESLDKFDSNAVYVPGHTGSTPETGWMEQGWTEKQYENDPNAGGFVRHAILSGGYAELRKARVDSEINSETITTSWSASIGENLRVGNNLGVAGYMQLGSTESLATSDQKGVDPQPGFAPNDENIPDLRLVVSDSALVQRDLYVGEDLRVGGDEAVTGSLHVSQSIYGSENFYLTGNAEISGTLKVVDNTYLSGNLQVVGDEAITGSLHVSQSIYGSENFYLTGDAIIGGDLIVSGAGEISDFTVHGDLIVEGSSSMLNTAVIDGNLFVTEDAFFEDNINVTSSGFFGDSIYVSRSAHVGGDLFVEGTSSLHNITVEGDLDVDNLVVRGSGSFGEDVVFQKNVVVQENLTVNGTFTHLNVDDLYVKDRSITLASGAQNPTDAEGAGFDIAGADVVFRYTSSTDSMGLNKRLDVTGGENITGSLAVTETIQGNNLNVIENVQVGGDEAISGSLFVSNSASINVARITQSYVTNEVVTQSTVLTQSVAIQNVTTQTVASQQVVSSSISQSTIVSGNIQNATINSGSANYLSVTNLNVISTQPATFQGDVVSNGNISGSNSGSFRDLEVANNAHIGNSASIDKFLHVGGQVSGIRTASVVVDTGSIEAKNSDLYVQKVVSDAVSASVVSSSYFYGDGRYLTGVTASINDVAADLAEYEITDPTAIYRFAHNLNSKNLVIQVYQEADTKTSGSTIINPVVVFPEQISIPDEGHVDIVFGRAPMKGYVVFAKAGHVISGFDIVKFIESGNVHYGTDGDWSAHSFTSNTASADVVIASEYVDAQKIGKLNAGPQHYYPSNPDIWDSYTIYNSASIDSFVRPANWGENNDIPQASKLDGNGNLIIRGNLTTNGIFNTSDFNRKENIRPIENALENLEKINGVRFDWKDGSGSSIGVIAQELKAIYPELTRVVRDLDGEELMTVEYNGLVGVLIEAIKELSARVRKLEEKE